MSLNEYNLDVSIVGNVSSPSLLGHFGMVGPFKLNSCAIPHILFEVSTKLKNIKNNTNLKTSTIHSLKIENGIQNMDDMRHSTQEVLFVFE